MELQTSTGLALAVRGLLAARAMQSRVYALVSTLVFAVPSVAAAEDWNNVKEPAKGAALSEWTPAQQYKFGRDIVSGQYAEIVVADLFGDKLSEMGRARVVQECLKNVKADATAVVPWTVCGADAKALDVSKIEAELKAGGYGDMGYDLKYIKELKDQLPKIEAAVQAAAKEDPGVAAILKRGEDARAEWSAWLGKNQDLYTRTRAMVDGVRSKKTNHPSFAGCWDKTWPAFQKLVKASAKQFSYDVSRDYLPTYWSAMLISPDSYMTATAFAECMYSVHDSGEGLVAASFDRHLGVLRWGPRTMTVSKLIDPAFQPKFADRSLKLESLIGYFDKYEVKLDGVNEIRQIQTPNEGVIANVKPDGEESLVSFKGNQVEACLQWVETNKVSQVSPNGTVSYDKVCKKRGMIDNQETAAKVSAKMTTGLKPGLNVSIVAGVPVVVWDEKAKKLIALFGVPLK